MQELVCEFEKWESAIKAYKFESSRNENRLGKAPKHRHVESNEQNDPKRTLNGQSTSNKLFPTMQPAMISFGKLLKRYWVSEEFKATKIMHC
ncbi:hypothetical protein Y1Q_0010706 [Alligator mississippiensis]|uniref:Uncharacterized protein n=1 Tax=Alligator mississippiensis TaxID=8496 RepID=A0A151M6H6_ALLMI|nr:hypothetical protein Y1Q_0010706 [Alligator mississippiensis]